MANFSCSMDPDEVKILQIKREDIGISWEMFMHYIVEIVKPLQDVEDLAYLKNNVHELKRKRERMQRFPMTRGVRTLLSL